MGFRRKLLLTCSAVLIIAGSALAQSQITLMNSAQAVRFAHDSTITWGGSCTTTCTLSGNARYDAFPELTGLKYSFVMNRNGSSLTYQQSGGSDVLYTINSGLTSTRFTFSLNGQAWLTADVAWTGVAGSTKPQLSAVLTNLTFGDFATPEFQGFKSAFWGPQSALLDMSLGRMNCRNLAPGQSCTLSNILSAANNNAYGEKNIVEGETIPAPEPASLVMLGSGLLVAGGAVRRRWKK